MLGPKKLQRIRLSKLRSPIHKASESICFSSNSMDQCIKSESALEQPLLADPAKLFAGHMFGKFSYGRHVDFPFRVSAGCSSVFLDGARPFPSILLKTASADGISFSSCIAVSNSRVPIK